MPRIEDISLAYLIMLLVSIEIFYDKMLMSCGISCEYALCYWKGN